MSPWLRPLLRTRARTCRLVVAFTLGAAAVVSGCATANSPGEAAAPSSLSSSSLSPTSAASADETLTQLAAAGVDVLLARDLADRADDLGYGPAGTTFALLMVDMCRDVAAGATSYDELADQDVANGAPRAAAEKMYEFLRTQYCPQVRPAADQDMPERGAGSAAPAGMQALGVSAASFPDLFRPGDQATCRAAEGAPIGTAAAYRLAAGATLCLDYIERDPLGDVQDDLSLVFDPPVPRDRALKAVASVLPIDARQVETLTGHNPPYAARDGSCLSVLYSSPAYGEYMSRYDSDEEFGITFDDQLTAMLYSDRQTADGSSSRFTGQVRFVDISSGGHNFASNSRDVTC